MPTFAEHVVDEVCRTVGNFDEQARSALLSNPDAISTLSILHRVAGHKEQVRNPSAFVVKAVRSGRERGPSGLPELENAILRLGESGFIDDSAGELMRRNSLQDVSSSVATFLSLDVSAVRNPSAYLTRSIVNARSGESKFAGHSGANNAGSSTVRAPAPPTLPPPPAAQGHRTPSVTTSASTVRARWVPSLDPKALQALAEVGLVAGNEVLQELEKQGSAVRNPSAYVQKACENRLRDVGLLPSVASSPAVASLPPPPSPRVSEHQYGQPGLSALMAKYGGSLDKDATEALRKLSPEGALQVLSNLDSKSGSIRNVSAYVVRSVFNFLKEDPQQGKGYETTGAAEGYGYAYETHTGYSGSQSGDAYAYDPTQSLDDRARQTLADLPHEVSQAILGELRNKGSAVQNPSAYVQKAAANARKEEAPPRQSWTENKAIGSSTKEYSYGGGDVGSATDTSIEALLEPWKSTLDADALRQLEGVGYEAAYRILSELEVKGDQVRNPSAYISKSTSNYKHHGQLGVSSGDTRPMESDLKRQFDQELNSLPFSLDEKALASLEEVGHQAALSILRNLQDQGGKVNNPNAYIMRACANEKRPDAKRRRYN